MLLFSKINDILYLNLLRSKHLYPVVRNYILEKFFLVKQLIIPDLVDQLILPYTIRFSPKAVWLKHFNYQPNNYEESLKLYKKDDLNYMANTGYKFLDDYDRLKYFKTKYERFSRLGNNDPKVKLFLYAVQCLF